MLNPLAIFNELHPDFPSVSIWPIYKGSIAWGEEQVFETPFDFSDWMDAVVDSGRMPDGFYYEDDAPEEWKEIFKPLEELQAESS